jgi:hypothetical protein
MPADARDDLAAQQSRLVEALTTGTPPPAGFDPAQVETAARALAAKRARSVAKAWPRLAEALGDQFEKRFADYASESPLPNGAEPRDDGRALARWLSVRRLLPDASRVELAADRVSRGFPLSILFLRDSHRPALLVRLPRLGVRVLGYRCR